MSISFSPPKGIHPKASPGVRLATLTDEELLWELGTLHASRAAGEDCGEAIVEMENEYLRRHPLHEEGYRSLRLAI